MGQDREERKKIRLLTGHDKIFVEILLPTTKVRLVKEVIDINEYGLAFLISPNEEYLSAGMPLEGSIIFNEKESHKISAEVLYTIKLDEDETDECRVGIKFKSNPMTFSYNRRMRLEDISSPNKRLAERRGLSNVVPDDRRKLIFKRGQQDDPLDSLEKGPSVVSIKLKDKRKYVRSSLIVPIIFDLNGITHKGYLRDISPNGLLITTNFYLALQTSLSVQLSFNNKFFMNVKGKVVSMKEVQDKNSGLFNLGVQYERMDEVEQKILTQYIGLLTRPLRKKASDFPSKQTVTILITNKTQIGGKLASRRVVITGIGAVAPNGIGREAFWKGLADGKNAVDTISFFDASQFPSKVAAEIRDFDPKTFIKLKEIKRMGRSSHLAIAAAQLAVRDGALPLTGRMKNPIAVIMGTGSSGLEYAEEEFYLGRAFGVSTMSPYMAIAGYGGALSSEVSRSLGLTGPSLTISTGCTGAIDAMGYAFNMLQHGDVNVAITGGADAPVSPGILGAFCQMGAVATGFNKTPKKASRPFNKDRDGFVIGEGSWIFIFEELNHAIRRNAKIYAEIVGYGSTCDAHHMSRPLPSGKYSTQAIRLALLDAMIQPQDVDYINAYGNATQINDSYETMVIKTVFTEHAYKLLISSTKSMIGHSMGACGAGGVAAALLALSEGIVHPTINYELPDPDCDLNYVPNKAVRGEIKIALCNTLAFGSKNSAMVLKKFEE